MIEHLLPGRVKLLSLLEIALLREVHHFLGSSQLTARPLVTHGRILCRQLRLFTVTSYHSDAAMGSRSAFSRSRPRPGVFEVKAKKAIIFSRRAVLKVKDSPRGSDKCGISAKNTVRPLKPHYNK